MKELYNFNFYKPKFVDGNTADVLATYFVLDPKEFTPQEIEQEIEYEKANQNRKLVIKILDRFKIKVLQIRFL